VKHANPPKAFVLALKHLLMPLTRALISAGITLPFFTELLKRVYVDAAQDFQVEGKRITDSRISLLTGVHRKDIKRLRMEADATPAPSKYATIGAQVVARWTGDPQYLDAHSGKPAALPRSGSGSFDTLVEAVNKDMRPRTLLDEWELQNIAFVDDDNLVHLNTTAFVPSRDYDDIAYFYGRNLHDHIAAATHNLHGEEPFLLERSTYYSGLSEESIAELETLSKEIGMEALMRINKEAMKRAKADANKSDAKQRFNFGVYFYRCDDNGDGENR